MIVGAGFAGATCARLLKDKGYSVVIIEERPFVGGNCATDFKYDIQIHLFDTHIIHTNNEDVWNFLKKYDNIVPTIFNEYLVDDKKRYLFSDDLQMCYDIYGETYPYQFEKRLRDDKFMENEEFNNLKEYLIYKYGETIYETVYRKYYTKIYNKDPENLPANIHQRIYNTLLFSDARFYKEIYQGIPENGYTKLIENIIGDDIYIMLDTNFLEKPKAYSSLADRVIYTGEIDRLFNYCIGKLEWTAADYVIRDESANTTNLLGCPVVNYLDKKVKWNKITEFKWLTPWKIGKSKEFDEHTIAIYKYYKEWEIGAEPMDLIRDNRSIGLYGRYLELLKKDYPNMLLCGKRAEYKNYSISDTIESAFKLCEQF